MQLRAIHCSHHVNDGFLDLTLLSQSQAIEAAGQIWVSGQIPADAQGNLVGGSIADQTKACCEALKNILEDAGSNINRTVKV